MLLEGSPTVPTTLLATLVSLVCILGFIGMIVLPEGVNFFCGAVLVPPVPPHCGGMLPSPPDRFLPPSCLLTLVWWVWMLWPAPSPLPSSGHLPLTSASSCLGEELIYLDPHTTQPAVELTDSCFIPDESFHCQHPPCRMGIGELDPSIAVVCPDGADS